ncbi:MAG: TlpA family protein disulfide reductase [Thermotogota bacterium]
MYRKIYFLLLIMLPILMLAQKDPDLEEIEGDFIEKYTYKESAQLEFVKKDYKFGRDTIYKSFTIKMFDNSFFKELKNLLSEKFDKLKKDYFIYYKINDSYEAIIDSKVDSIYYHHSSGRLSSLPVKQGTIGQLKRWNRFNPFISKINFFPNISKSKIISNEHKNNQHILKLYYTEKTDYSTEINDTLWLNLTDTSITKLKKKVKSTEYPHLNRYLEIDYLSERKNDLSMSFQEVKTKMLSKGNRSKKSEKEKTFSIGDVIHDYEYVSLEGDTVRLQAFDNNYFLIELWYMGCPPCLTVLPYIKNLYRQFPDVKVVGVNVWDNVIDDIKTFKKTHKIPYDLFYNGQFKDDYQFSCPKVLVLNSDLEIINIVDIIKDQNKKELKEYLKHLE